MAASSSIMPGKAEDMRENRSPTKGDSKRAEFVAGSSLDLARGVDAAIAAGASGGGQKRAPSEAKRKERGADQINAATSFSGENGSEAPASSGSLLRGLSIIAALAELPTPILLTELAERVRLDSSTVHRLTQILCREGYAVRLNSKRYCAGPRAIRLLSTYHPVNSLCNESESTLHQLRDRIGETVMLIIFVGIERVIVKVVQGREILSPSYETWLRTPLHGSASGKVLLMQMSGEQQQALLGPPPYPSITEYTVRESAELLEQLNLARSRGFAVARDDALVGMTALAAPITWNTRALGCIAVVGSSSRLAPKVEESLGSAIRETATLIVNAAPAVRALAHFVGA